MFCSHCGAAAANKFCSECGKPLQQLATTELSADWRSEVRYQVLLHFQEVRDLIAQAATQAKKAGMTGEEWLELFDKAYVPLVGVSLKTVSSIIVPIYSRMGLQTSKQRTELLAQPAGQVIVNTLCTLARSGRPLKEVHQASDGCVIEATIASDIWSFAGQLLVSIHQQDRGTKVEATAKIPGQLYDWGKSEYCLQALFAELQIVPAQIAA